MPTYDANGTIISGDQLPSFQEVRGLAASTLNADLVPATDVSLYKFFALQINGTWVGTLSFQGSNDGITFLSVSAYSFNAGSVTNFTANDLFQAPIGYRFLRVRMTGYTSGQALGLLELYSVSPNFAPISFNVFGVGGTYDISDRSARLLGKVDGSGVTQPVSGVFWQATQPISATSLPLPTNAAQETGGNLATIAAALDVGQETMSNSLAVVIASDQSTVPVSGTFWQATQPISGTVTSNQGTANATPWNENIAQVGGATFTLGQQPAAASLPIVLTAAQLTTLTPPAAITGFALDTSVNGVIVGQASTTSGQKGPMVQGAVTSAAPGYTNAQTSPLSLTTVGALRTDASATTQPVSGTFWQTTQPVSIAATVTVTASNLQTNLNQIAGSAVSTAATGIIKVGLTDGSGNGITSTSSAIDVNIKSGGGAGFSVVDEAAWTAGTSSFVPAGGVFNDSAAALTSGQQGDIRLTTNRAIHSNIRNASGTELATSSNPLRTDPTGTTTQPVSLASLPALAAGTASIGAVTQGTGAAAGTSWRIEGDYTEQASLSAASLNADLLASLDVSTYKWFSLQVTALATGGVLTIQWSNDNTTFYALPAYSVATGMVTTVSTVSAVYGFIPGRYFRIRQTSWSSGTTTGVVELYTIAPPYMPTTINVFSTGGTINPGNTANTTPWLVTVGPTNVGTQVDVSATGTNATVTATMAAVASKTNYLTGYEITGLPATVLSSADITISGLQNTLTAEFSESTTQGSMLAVSFHPPRAASAQNTAISVSVAALGASSAKCAVNCHGFVV
jgi:hypothetical protein